MVAAARTIRTALDCAERALGGRYGLEVTLAPTILSAMSTVYRKTEKGLAEIDTRAFRLLPRLRQALILVDGRRTDIELAKLILAEPDATLTWLAQQGFIEAIATIDDVRTAERAAAAAVPAAAEPGKPATPSPDQLRREAVRFLNDQLGPAAEGVSIKLERAKSMAELRPLLVSAGQLLRSARGAATAEAFAARFLSAEPAS